MTRSLASPTAVPVSTKALRIVHAIHSDAFSGVERHVALLAGAQQAAGHQVVVVGGDPAAMRTATLDNGVRLLPGATLSSVARATNQWAPGADVLHVHMTGSELAAGFAPGARGVPVLATRHFAGRRGTGRFGGVGRLVSPLMARRLSAQIAVSRYVASHIDGDSIVVHAGVHPVERPTPTDRRQPLVLVAQRLEAEKRTDLALRAFARSGLGAHGWTLAVAGAGAQLPGLQRLAHALGVSDDIRFLGRVADVPQLMARASLFLATRPDEAYGLSVLEAMAAGLPVVATGAAGHLETLGLVPRAALFPPGDVDAAAAMLERLATDATERDRLAGEQRAVQQRDFTLEAQQRRTEDVYRSVL